MPVNSQMNVTAVATLMVVKSKRAIVNAAGDSMKQTTPKTPYRKGELRTKRRITPIALGARAQWLANHAGAQNAGQSRGRVFRNYTTPGTGKGFVEAFIKAFPANLMRRFK